MTVTQLFFALSGVLQGVQPDGMAPVAVVSSALGRGCARMYSVKVTASAHDLAVTG